MTPDASFLTGLPPILDTGLETLFLGSFPSPASLVAGQYYAHKKNQFWRVMASILGEPLLDVDYAEKRRCLLHHRIGVWDVYRQCRREGALDSAIRAAVQNDFSVLAVQAPGLRRVCFNGKEAARNSPPLVAQGYEVRVLPSTSPAYTLAFERKLELWRMGLAQS